MSAAHRDPARRPAGTCSGSTPVNSEVAAPRLLTADEAAAFLKKSRAAFYAWRRRHHIPNCIVGRALRFRLDDLVVASTPAPTTTTDYAELGRQHARGETRWPH